MNEFFEEDGYLIVRNFLSKDLCNFAKVYFKIKQDTLDYDIDIQCPDSKSFYGDIFCESILLTSIKTLSELSGIDLIPTYSYARVYAKGDELKIHVDRKECQYSATLCLGRPSNESISPIYFSKNEDGSDASELYLEEGDLCLYKGNDMYHWRTPFEQKWYLQTFLHYVDANGPYANTLFDGRRTLGLKKNNKY
jgi:hypothetical protein